jgi:hypothetical protein
MKLILVLLLTSVLVCCHKAPAEKSNNDEFTSGEELAEVKNKRLEEASGLVASISNEGLLWTHNDSGNPPELFLIDEKVNIKLTCKLQGVQNRDWEDVAAGPGPESDKNYLYVAEIGDNMAQYDLKMIYRFEEPAMEDDSVNYRYISNFEIITFRLKDRRKDTEALMIHPETKDLYVVSKREDPVVVYKLPYPQSTTDTLTAEPVATIPVSQIVACDFSPDGTQILMKNYQNVFFWAIADNETAEDALKRAPKILPYKEEPQGESIAFSRDGKHYYTISEKVKGERSYLSVYRRK